MIYANIYKCFSKSNSPSKSFALKKKLEKVMVNVSMAE